MCTAQGWKPTGDKPRLVRRIVKEVTAYSKGKEGIVSLIESKVGPKLGNVSPPARLRDFYRRHYQSLDRFDRDWYEIRFHRGARDWESYFCWSLLHAAVVNARAVWCALHDNRVPIKDFLHQLVTAFVRTLTD